MFGSNRFRLFVAAVFFCSCVCGVQAQTPELTPKQAATQELLDLLGATQVAKAIFVTLIDQYAQALSKDSVQSFEAKNWPPEIKEKAVAITRDFYTRLAKRLREEVPSRLHYEETVNRLYLDAYAEYFSEAEIRELIGFYKSPAGQKFLGFGPKVSTTLQQKAMAEIETPTLNLTKEIVAEEIKELEKRAAVELKQSGPPRKN